MITEEQQRQVYEWLYDDILIGEWGLRLTVDRQGKHNGRVAMYTRPDGRVFAKILLPLYIDGNPNINFWQYECVPKLKAERVTVRFGFAGDDHWYIDPIDGEDAYSNPDPYAALVEMLEARC